MLKFHYHPLSPVARGVWLLLLEKQIPFEPIAMDIRTRNPDLLAINPFHHVPVIIDIPKLPLAPQRQRRSPRCGWCKWRQSMNLFLPWAGW
jgi:glutathione S-transferase